VEVEEFFMTHPDVIEVQVTQRYGVCVCVCVLSFHRVPGVLIITSNSTR
jgi:hypothetical protein